MRVLKQQSDQDLHCLPFYLASFELNFIPRHTIVVGYYGFTLVSLCPSVHLSICCMFICLFLFPDDNFNGSSPNMVCVLIWWRSAFCIFVSGHFYTPPHDSDRALWFQVGVPVSVCPSIHLSFVCQSVGIFVSR